MRKNISIIAIASLLLISGLSNVSAYYTPYYNNYVNAPTSNSYTFQQGCYTYSYDAYTRITSLIGSTCQVNTNNNYNNNYNDSYSGYNSYTYPTYSSSYYPTYSSNSYQTNYAVSPSTNQYYTFSYNNGNWAVGGSANTGYGNNGYNYYDNYNSNYNNNYNGRVTTPTNPCYYVNGYYTCY